MFWLKNIDVFDEKVRCFSMKSSMFLHRNIELFFALSYEPCMLSC